LSTYQQSTIESREPVLEAVLSDRFVLTWQQMAVVGLTCMILVLISLTRLSTTSIWISATRGEAILQTGQLPQYDVAQSLAESRPFVETSWLSNVFWAMLLRNSIEAISWGTTILASIAIILLSVILWKRTKNSWLTAVGILWFSFFNWSELTVGSALLFVIPLWIGLLSLNLSPLGTHPRSWTTSVGTLFFVVLWANLDGSVYIAIAFLTALVIAECCQKFSERKSLPSLLKDRALQHSLVLLQLCILATLATPIGTQLWTHWIQELQMLGSGYSIHLDFLSGLSWLASLVLFCVVLRNLRDAIDYQWLIPLTIFGVGSLVSDALLVFLAPIAILVMLPLLQHCFSIQPDAAPIAPPADDERSPALRFAFSLGAVLLCWIAFVLSPLSSPVLGRESRTVVQLFEQDTPFAAIQYFRENPVQGIVFARPEWSNLLQSHRGGNARVFATTELDLLPQQALFDYGRLSRGESYWEKTADRYAIDAFLIDKKSQPTLAEVVQESSADWKIVLENESSLILRRSGV